MLIVHVERLSANKVPWYHLWKYGITYIGLCGDKNILTSNMKTEQPCLIGRDYYSKTVV